ncbi:Perlucin [Folsomia candida]|uniref:Perlucin n=1 Tax=Folsomia candida TaxID=158441 RepID=A0A226DEM7_FOLCA|nr:Perlucin [Folsomia candida]
MASKLGLLMVLWGVAQLESAVIPKETYYTFLGTYGRLGKGGKYDEVDYYVTFNSKVPIDAERDCEAVFAAHGGGSLVEFGDVAEMDAVNRWLDQYGAGLLYWTGGVYDAIDGYYWKESNEIMTAPVIQHILVTSPPRKVDQLVFSHDSSRRYHMELRPNSNAEAYICEVKRPEKAKSTVETQEKYDCILERIRLAGLPDDTNYWTAGNDLGHEGDFLWDGVGTRVAQFYPAGNGQPDNMGGHENCVSVRKVFPGAVQSAHCMNDEVCDLKFATLCE